MLSTSFKFSKKDTPCNRADTRQNRTFLAFPSDLSCVTLLLRNKNYNYMLLILIFIYIYIYHKNCVTKLQQSAQLVERFISN